MFKIKIPKLGAGFQMRLRLSSEAFFFFFLLNGDSKSESQSSLGVLGSSEPDCLEKVGVWGQKIPWFSITAARKSIPGAGEAVWAQQGLGTPLSCSCQSQGMHLAKGKDAEKLTECRERSRNNPRARKNALQWEAQWASPLYLIRKKNESDLITAQEHLLGEKTPF